MVFFFSVVSLNVWSPFTIILFLVIAIAFYFIVRYFVRKLEAVQKIFKLMAERRNREIREKNEELEKNNLIKTRLISIISHDLVSPLRFIHIASKNLIENKEKMTIELQDEVIAEISNTSKELELLSNNILNWIKYQNENRRLVKEDFDVYEMSNQIISVFLGLARQKNIRLVNEIEKGLVINQYFEPIKIVLYNLMLNALNFTEKGIITISGNKTKLGILIKIKDEGVGMTPEQIKNILSEDFIVSSLNVDRRKGNGLGYLIIKDLLKFVNAKFVIKSRKNKGTTVTIILQG